MSSRTMRKHCSCEHCAALREARRRVLARQNHPIYAARGNEQPLLQELIESEPPEGGLASYVANMSKE